MIVVSRRTLFGAALAVLALVFLALGWSAGARTFRLITDPVAVADASTLAQQRDLAERGIERAYEKGIDQLKQTRALHLPIPAGEADAILAKYTAQLRQLRHAALASLADSLAIRGAEQDRYVAETEARLDGEGVQGADPNALLAPTLGAIVRRAADLAGPIADAGTRAMASAPSPSPTVSASPRR